MGPRRRAGVKARPKGDAAKRSAALTPGSSAGVADGGQGRYVGAHHRHMEAQHLGGDPRMAAAWTTTNAPRDALTLT